MPTTTQVLERALARANRAYESETAKKAREKAHRNWLQDWGAEVKRRQGVETYDGDWFRGGVCAAKRCLMEAIIAFESVTQSDLEAMFGSGVSCDSFNRATDLFALAAKALEEEGLPVRARYDKQGLLEYIAGEVQ